MKLNRAAYGLIIALILVYVLIIGKELLVPFVIAIVIWYLVNSIKKLINRIIPDKFNVPSWIIGTLAYVFISFLIGAMGVMLKVNLNALSQSLPIYQNNMQQLFAGLDLEGEWEVAEEINTFLNELDYGRIIQQLINAITGLFGNSVIIILYIIFLNLESRFSKTKLKALYPDSGRFSSANDVIKRINKAVHDYVVVKCLVSGLTGVLSYIVLVIMEVDFAFFWAILITLLNFIPTVGSIVGTIFPTLMYLVQVQNLTWVLALFGCLGVIQLVIGNFIEPKLVGKSLNISSLVVVMALVFWGSIWGIPGMILCVPITVILNIIMANFSSTKKFAILLSENGQIHANGVEPEKANG